MIRIRYARLDGLLTSTSPLRVNYKDVYVTINLASMTFSICNEDDFEVLAVGANVSEQLIKRQVKRALKKLGCKFRDEVRITKKFILENKGEVE